MPTWNSDQYLKFAAERTQPAIDLALRLALSSPEQVIDLGCGPGNSTDVLARRFPHARVTGLDNSAAMLATARRDFPQHEWIESDIAAWQRTEMRRFDVVFSNAALQWLPDHRNLVPRLLDNVGPGGALAIQLPANLDSPPQRVIRELAATTTWRPFFTTPPREWFVHPPEFYYDVLASRVQRLDLWTTDYHHVLENLDGIVEWYRGTGLRPWLDALPDDATRTKFLGAYRARLVPYFPERADTRILFPFRRLFLIAYK